MSKVRIFTMVLLVPVAMTITGCATETSDPSDAAATSSVDPGATPDSVAVPGATTETDSSGVVPFQPTDDAAEILERVTIGSPAPELAVASWIRGEPIEQFHDGQVYVVEFWATWCPPCKESMPHLSNLQQEYGDQVRFIGVTSETDDEVAEFLTERHSSGATWDEVVQYAIATDDGGRMSNSWMRAAGENGIPAAFVVGRDGHVEWIGHPMAIDEPLALVVAAEWDRQVAIAEAREQKRIKAEIRAAMPVIERAVGREDWDTALSAVDQLIEQLPEMAPQFKAMELSILHRAGRVDELAVLMPKFVDENWDDPKTLEAVSWNITTSKPPGDLELAMRAAKRASELTEDGDPLILETIARVYYTQGNLEEAVAWQQRAVELSGQAPELAETLFLYEAELADATSSEEETAGDVDLPADGSEAAEAENDATADSAAEHPDPSGDTDVSQPGEADEPAAQERATSSDDEPASDAATTDGEVSDDEPASEDVAGDGSASEEPVTE